MFFLPEGNFDFDAGDGGGWGVEGTIKDQKSTKKQNNPSYEYCSHFCDIFRKMFKTIFKIWSYIQKTTQNPINTLEKTIYDTKHTQNTKIHFKKSKMLETNRKTSKTVENTHRKKKGSFFYFIIYPISIFRFYIF